jgi:hypothetical protein
MSSLADSNFLWYSVISLGSLAPGTFLPGWRSLETLCRQAAASSQGWRQRKREGESGGLYSGVAAEKVRGGIRGPALRGVGRDRERWNQEFCTQGWRQRKRKGESGDLYSGVTAETERGGIEPLFRGG